MATEKLEIQVSADVKNAVTNLHGFRDALATTAKASATFIAGMGAAGVALAFAAPLIDEFKENLAELKKEFIESIDPQRKYTDALKASTPDVIKNAGSVVQLVNALENGKLSYKETQTAQQELVRLAPTFKDAFDKNGVAVKDLSDVLFDDYIPALVNTIRLNAATAIINTKLQKSFETIASQGTLTGLEKLKNSLVDAFGPIAGTKTSQFGKLNQALARLSPETIAAEIKTVYDNLGISIEDFGKRIAKSPKDIKTTTDKIIDLLKNYKEQLRLIEFKETSTGVDLLNQKIELASKTFQDFIAKGIDPQSAAFQRVQGDLNNYLNSVRDINVELERAQKLSLDPTIKNAPRKTNPINIENADRTSSVVITPEALQLQGQYLLQMDEILARQKQMQELAKQFSDVLTNGLNAGIDQFFNAIANNQDPFEALQQSVKRLVAELAAAVVKALVLKAVTAAFTGGSSAGVSGLSGLFGGGVLRGDQIRSLTFLRG
jgi:hypothetical protein